MANRYLEFVMSDAGQVCVDRAGLIGQGLATEYDQEQAKELLRTLVQDESIPIEYRQAISDADRS